jgi:hypothetical protein
MINIMKKINRVNFPTKLLRVGWVHLIRTVRKSSQKR